jgi:MYXO-CTERM domain-containing protein
MKLNVSISGAVAAFAMVLTLPGPGHANSAGKNGRSGLEGPNCSAAGCHDNGAETDPTIAVTGLETNLEMGSPVSVTITVTSNNADPANRRAGINAAIDGSIGTLTASNAATQNLGAVPNEITHAGKQAYTDGAVSFTFDLLANTPGAHTLYIFANDTNNNGTRNGDTPFGTTVNFTVDGDLPDAGPAPDSGPAADAGPSPTPDAGPASQDAGSGEEDAGDGNGGGNGDGNGGDDGGDDGGDSPGCGARTVSSDLPWPALFTLAFGFLLLRRRRR